MNFSTSTLAEGVFIVLFPLLDRRLPEGKLCIFLKKISIPPWLYLEEYHGFQ